MFANVTDVLNGQIVASVAFGINLQPAGETVVRLVELGFIVQVEDIIRHTAQFPRLAAVLFERPQILNQTAQFLFGQIAVQVNPNYHTIEHISHLVKNTVFDVDDTEYLLTSAALFKTANAAEATTDNSRVYTGSADVLGGSITVAQLDADTWGTLLEVPATGVLSVTNDLDNGLLVSSDLEKLYGALSKSTSGYTLAKGSANTDLTGIAANGAKLNMASHFAKARLRAGDSEFSGVTLNDSANTFTLDATDVVAGFSSNVAAFILPCKLRRLRQNCCHRLQAMKFLRRNFVISGRLL